MNRVEKRDFILTAICKTYQELWIKGLIGVNK